METLTCGSCSYSIFRSPKLPVVFLHGICFLFLKWSAFLLTKTKRKTIYFTFFIERQEYNAGYKKLYKPGKKYSDQDNKRVNKPNTYPTRSLTVWARISILRKDACVHRVNFSIYISCMCVTKLVKVILIWKTKTIKIQAVQINRRVSNVKSIINQF